MDVTVVGSCNIDLISYVSRFPKPGETLQGSRFLQGFGGKGANQCVTVAKLGGKTAMVSKVGDDTFGEAYIKNFKDLGINTEFCFVAKETSTGVAPICVDENSGQNSIVIVPGANLLLSENDLDTASEVISRSKVIVCQLEIDPKVTLAALKMARRHKVKTILNPAPALQLEADFLKHSDIFCPNESETEILTGQSVKTVEDAKLACKKLQEMGCSSVIITLGGMGCVVAEPGAQDTVHVPAPTVNVVDSTGAGDSFIGSLAFFLATQSDISLVDAAQRAVQIASESVQKPGTQKSYPTRGELPPQLFVF